ncbi:hypothetical protein [Flavobacterium xinjiangense]|uniref:Uncharacterized protein n=1 Tax=Flavobacterium xinjiangense TaxID=178356 RepID=A0A1M7NBN6_9FLAO|nr:hypothetical protein [Flavobacterium xinjiangense]SHN01068.1 hypothetical protein SAMN05216269_110110 [Flavobacterium xinjiangense]
MKKSNETDDLNETIALLEYRQKQELRILKEQFEVTYDSLKPLNIIKKAFNDMTTSSELKGNLINNVIGMSTGYLTKKLLLGSSHNPFKRILGNVLQFVITNVVTKHTDAGKPAELLE